MSFSLLDNSSIPFISNANNMIKTHNTECPYHAFHFKYEIQYFPQQNSIHTVFLGIHNSLTNCKTVSANEHATYFLAPAMDHYLGSS